MQWSNQQLAIFDWFAGNHPARQRALTIRARAGTGKTTTILEAISYSKDASIMLSAFNKSIASELQARLKHPFAEAKTLHGLGYGIIRRYWPRTIVNNFRTSEIAARICGRMAPEEMAKLTAKLAAKAKEMVPWASVPDDLLDIAEEFDCIPDDEWAEDGWDTEAICSNALATMRACAEADGTVDFSDMLYIPIANGWVRGKYDLVVIDEAQDMNAAQIILARGSVKKSGRLVVVGDDRQAIYGFRGADSGVIDRIKEETCALELPLTVTYRCPKLIVERAQAIVPDFTAHESAPDGAVVHMPIAKAIQAAQPGDFVLSRANAPLVGVCLAILRTGMRARIQGKDIGAGLIALVNKWKSRSMPEFLARLRNWEEREIKRAEAAAGRNMLTKIDKIRDQADTIRHLSDGLSGIPELRTRIESLFADNGAPAVICSSVHKAKGLEADTVYVLSATLRSRENPPCACHHYEHIGTSCAKCKCTHYTPDQSKLQEETNIEYVAITRAKNTLVWVSGEV